MAIVSDVEIRLRADIARLQQDMNRVRRSVDTTMNQVTRAANVARNALIGITAGIGFSELASLTDSYTKFTAQLKLASTSQREYAQSLEDVKRIATTAQNDIQTTGVLYARIASSTRELGVAQRDVAKITETVNLALAATGASTSEASSAMLQLSQAFGSGVLRGEEFNAVNEAAPKLLRILADSMDIPFSKLRSLAEQGKLTTDVLARAFSNDEVIKGLRENVAQITTISGALTVFRNNLMEVVGTQAHASGVVAALTSGILAAASAIGTLTSVLGPALKIGAAYVAAFVIAPPLFLATSRAIGNLQVQIALMKMEMASGATVASLFAGSLGGVSVAAQLASGSLTKLTLATNLLFSAYVGWEIGKYLESQFVEVEIAAEVMTGELLKHWERVKFAGKVAFDALTVFAREAVSKIASALASGQELIAKGFRLIGDNRMADGIEAYAAKVREATKVEGTFAGRTAESMNQMEKQIALIDRDTDRRSSAALIRTRLVEGVERGENAVAAAVSKASEADKKAVAEAKKHADAYRDLIRALSDRADATAREAAGLPPLTAAEQAHLDLTRQLTDGKIKLSKVQEATARSLIDEAGANEVLTKSAKEYQDLLQQLADNAKDLAQQRGALIDSARQEAEQNEFLVQTFGMAEDAIIRLQAARLKEQEAQRLGRELTAEEIADLERVIELKERSANAVANRAELEAAKQFWTDIDKTAHDTFVSIADGGKNAFQRLKDTAKNVFFDWLYQQTIKKWIINIQANGNGIIDQVKGLFSGSSSGGSVLSSIGSIFGGSGGKVIPAKTGVGAFGGAASYAGWIAAGMAVASKLFESGYQNTNTINKKDYVHPLVAESLLFNKVFKTIGLNDKMANLFSGASIATALFGRKNPKIENQGIQGTFGAGGFNGQAFADIVEKGGLFRSTKRYTKTAALDAEQQNSFSSTITDMVAAVKGFGQVLGAETSTINGYSKQIKLTFGKDEAANQQMIADLFSTIGDELATRLIPNIRQFQQAGETAAATLQRVATNFAAVDVILATLGVDSQTAFRAVGVASIEARERLVAFAGGLDVLAAQVDFFNQNFLSAAEQVAPLQRQVNEQLMALGYGSVKTADQFKAAVQGLAQSGALATAEGAKTYAALLALAPAFKTVTDYLNEVNEAARQSLRSRADIGLSALERAVSAEKDTVSQTYESLMDRLGVGIDSLGDSISRATDLSRALKSSLAGVDAPGQLAGMRAAAQAQVQGAIDAVRTGGALPSTEDLQDVLTALQQDASGQFSSLADYQREVARTNNQLNELGGLTDEQLSTAERQLKTLQEQRDQAARAHEAELMRLDNIVLAAQNELSLINGVNPAILTVTEAVMRVDATLRELRTVTPGAIGPGIDTIPPLFEVRGADSQTASTNEALLTEMRAMNARLAAIEDSNQQTANAARQQADQFNQVSGGGNALVVETA